MLDDCSPTEGDGPYLVRTPSANDNAEVNRLARDGLLPGDAGDAATSNRADSQGTKSDHPAYKSLWVVETEGHIVGTIAMVHIDHGTSRVLQLRIAPEFQGDDRIFRLLIRAAAECARQRGVQKIMIESPGLEVPDEGESFIVQLLRSLGFEYSRTTEARGKLMLEFYYNLYDPPGLTQDISRTE